MGSGSNSSVLPTAKATLHGVVFDISDARAVSARRPGESLAKAGTTGVFEGAMQQMTDKPAILR
jgi:hypothetical protein